LKLTSTPLNQTLIQSAPIHNWESWIKFYHSVEKTTIQDNQFINITLRNPIPGFRVSVDELNKSLSQVPGNIAKVITDLLIVHGIAKHYKNTLLALFDIQAYSQFINQQETPEMAIAKVNEFMRGVRINTDFYSIKLDFTVLSDTVIMVVDTTRAPLFTGSVESMLTTSSWILETAMKLKLPVRGAIGGGDYFSDGEMIISTALVDAATFEKEQDWLGAVITPTALKLIEGAEKNSNGATFDINSTSAKNYVRNGRIPWKKGFEKKNPPNPTYYIKPFKMNEKDWATSYLPDYFDCPEKVKNSHCLYQED
jgi:hypothetical protein